MRILLYFVKIEKFNFIKFEKVMIKAKIIFLDLLIFILLSKDKLIFSGKYNHINEFPIIKFINEVPIIVDIDFNF